MKPPGGVPFRRHTDSIGYPSYPAEIRILQNSKSELISGGKCSTLGALPVGSARTGEHGA